MRITSIIVALSALFALTLADNLLGAQDIREQTADQQAIHALNRLSFGARPGDVQRIRSMGLDKWIEQQLKPERINDSRTEQFIDGYKFINQDQNGLLSAYARMRMQRRDNKKDQADGKISRRDSTMLRQQFINARNLVLEMQSARVARAVLTERQLQEVVTDFWLNHFNVYYKKGGPQAFYLPEYDETIRKHSFGNFRDLLGAVAKSPAMLFYLDNARSMADSSHRTKGSLDRQQRFTRARRGSTRAIGNNIEQRVKQMRKGIGLNENYARELLELHTLGVDGGYTQKDVIEVARALTGWTINQQDGGKFVFRPEMHDADEKIVLGRKLDSGRGIEDGEDVLDIVARHPATAHYIATKLARRFVSDSPPKSLVDRAAAVFTKTDGDIREVVRAIVTSDEFFSQAAYRAKVKSPFEVVVSTARALDAEPDRSALTALAVAYLGQPIFGHQAPNGWPETGESWMNTGAILNRINFGSAVAANRLPGVQIDGLPNASELRTAPRERQVDGVIQALLGGSVSPDTRQILISGQNPLSGEAQKVAQQMPAAKEEELDPSMTMSDGHRKGQSANARNVRIFTVGQLPQLTGLAQIVGLAIGSPEFQRR